MESITINPIGYVVSEIENPDDMPVTGRPAAIGMRPDLLDGLHRIEEHSHSGKAPKKPYSIPGR
ncbi:MAG: hypothetical protein K6T65_05375 [Peptococcaceae bacterium]|nr:hypothetical protein [Peptococcaceae bacterium]